MTFSDLAKIIEVNHIPEDVKLLGNSGWECDPTDVDGVYYLPDKNELHLTQGTESDYEKGRMGNCRWVDIKSTIHREIETNIPQAPRYAHYVRGEGGYVEIGFCPMCDNEVHNDIGRTQHHCPACGLPLKW